MKKKVWPNNLEYTYTSKNYNLEYTYMSKNCNFPFDQIRPVSNWSRSLNFGELQSGKVRLWFANRGKLSNTQQKHKTKKARSTQTLSKKQEKALESLIISYHEKSSSMLKS